MTDDLTTRRSPRTYLVAALALLVVAVGAVAYASRSDPPHLSASGDAEKLPVGKTAPGLDGAKGWINSAPLSGAQLTGKVVVYDFWTYSCVNCLRTIPYLRSWYDRYRADGLVVMGVHTPEFDFEKVHANVAEAVKRLGVTWPVALDDDRAIWDGFANNYWPAKYVADRNGHLRYSHFGEGEYATTEDVLRTLLGVDPASPRAVAPGQSKTGAGSPGREQITAETYLGLERGHTGARPGRATYPYVASLPPGSARLVGEWAAAAERVEAQSAGASVMLSYRAREVNMVLAPPADGPVDVVVSLDGMPLPAADRTAQTVVEAGGAAVVHVDHSDLYRLVVAPSIGEHTVRVTARRAGLQAYSFTFG